MHKVTGLVIDVPAMIKFCSKDKI